MKRGRPGLTADQGDRVLAALRGLLPLYKGNVTALAAEVGISQPALSQLFAGKNRASFATAQEVARLLGVPWQALLGATEEQPDPAERYPERRRAIVRLKGLLPVEVEESILSTRFEEGKARLSEEEWIEHALYELRQHRRKSAMSPAQRAGDEAAAERDTEKVARATRPRKAPKKDPSE